MLSVDLPVSLNVSFSVSPLSRLTPLKDASCDVVLICASTLLYCATSAARELCEFGSATGPEIETALKPLPEDVAVPPSAPIVEDAASFEVVSVSLLVEESNVACRLLAASWALSAFSGETWPAPRPKVMLVAVPPPVAAIVSVLPLRASPVADRPSLASAEPESVTPLAPPLMLIAPPESEPLTPAAALMVDSR